MHSTTRKTNWQELEGIFDDQIPIGQTDRQRRILQWHIKNCPKCSKYLKEYQKSSAVGDSNGIGVAGASGPHIGANQEISRSRDEDANEAFDIFASSPLFRGLSLKDQRQIFSHGRILELDAGATVIEEATVNSSIYVVLSGEFRVSLPAGPDRYGEVELARRRAPDCFGEYAFIDYKLAAADVTSTRKSRLYKIDFDVLDQFIDSNPILGRALYENVLLLLVARLRAQGAELDVFGLQHTIA